MAYRKFFAGDAVIINHYRYPSHDHHRALVMGTRKTRYLSGDKSPLISYRVDCECGASLLPLARHMDLVSTAPTSDVRVMRRQYFLAEIGVHSKPDDTLEQQVDAALGILTDKQRAIIVQRFGLDEGEAGRTLRGIAEALGVSKQYISEVAGKSLRKLRSFPGLVKEPV
tara:strand:+ start:341 stop:847 length:507 start_codon:yes stop_codon:yes gene_type:complete